MEEDVATEIAVAQKMDSAGCVAKLLCEIEAMSADQLTPAMSTFKTAFDNNSNLKGSRGVYDLAITFGSKFAKKDAKACSALFDKCVLSRDDLSFMLDSTSHASHEHRILTLSTSQSHHHHAYTQAD
nr:uncharacterized protein LOC113812372 [Penaeus vannamei]